MMQIHTTINHLVAKFNLPFIRYLMVGGWNTLFGVGLYIIAYTLLQKHVHYLVLSIPCNIIAITNAYICYKLFVFRTRGNWLREYLRFYVVYGVAMIVGMALLALFVEVFHLHPAWASIVITAITVVFSFFGHKRISFKPPTAP